MRKYPDSPYPSYFFKKRRSSLITECPFCHNPTEVSIEHINFCQNCGRFISQNKIEEILRNKRGKTMRLKEVALLFILFDCEFVD